MKCPQCGYEWTPRTKRPKKCPNPRCQHWFVKLPLPKLALLLLVTLLTACDRKEHPLPLISPMASTPAPITKNPVIVIMGQSNALGAGMSNEFNPVSGISTDMPRRGPGYATAANLVNKLGPLKLITCAVGGSPMEQWSTYGDLYRGCITTLQMKMGPNDYLALLLFDQGESEAGLNVEYPWAEHFMNSMRDFRTHYPSAPIVYAQLGANTLDPSQIPEWNYIQNQQASVILPQCEMVSTMGLDVAGEHYTESGYAELGRRMAQAYLQINL